MMILFRKLTFGHSRVPGSKEMVWYNYIITAGLIRCTPRHDNNIIVLFLVTTISAECVHIITILSRKMLFFRGLRRDL